MSVSMGEGQNVLHPHPTQNLLRANIMIKKFMDELLESAAKMNDLSYETYRIIHMINDLKSTSHQDDVDDTRDCLKELKPKFVILSQELKKIGHSEELPPILTADGG